MRNNCRLPVDVQFKIRFPRGRHAGRSSHFEVRIAINHTNVQKKNIEMTRQTKTSYTSDTKYI